MKVKMGLLIISFLLLALGATSIGVVFAVNGGQNSESLVKIVTPVVVSNPGDVSATNNNPGPAPIGNSATQTGRIWKVVTLAENLPCDESTTPSFPTEHYSNMLIYRIPNVPGFCVSFLDFSPDNSNWFEFLGPGGAPQSPIGPIDIAGPYFRVRTGADSGRFTIKAYLYAD